MRDAGQLTREEHKQAKAIILAGARAPAAPLQRSLPLVTFKQRCPNSSRRLLNLAGRQKSKSRRNCLSCVAYLRDRTVIQTNGQVVLR
jgi:hypothetical protein